ncbi:binding-protein-dependent transport systems inner membrane component [Methanocaldococcus infernus ME]|uniref:Binding-protein-dependent transport systems inner membrane component n=1 Tax=Methanocaldococcus infernus (strain DSM 11812 / JCM 15783 / ME) TaxID=573063 RepID=D5VT44_METIM|nr:iron ABC transporter permease [Methanocaldococcus infernus]ADG13747.1 binding-protein-dependent transport systems inner membrane component [Methanocaldococcus infernus ME]
MRGNKNIVRFLPHIFAFIFLAIFVAYPILMVFIQSFYENGVFTLKYYYEVISNVYYLDSLKNSLMVACLSTIISLLMGLLFSILIFKADIKGKLFFKIAVFLPIITPGFVVSLSYVFLFGRNGIITNGLLGLEPNIYSWKSVVIMQSIDYTTTAFLIISAVLLSIDSSLEDAARNLGANELRVFKDVTLPLLLPGILSAGLLIFMESMADFVTPIIVGGNFNTLATAAYFEIIGNYNTVMASTLSVVLLIPSLILFIVYNKFYKGYSQKFLKVRPYSLKKWHKILLSLPAVIFSIVVYLLFFSVFLAGFTKGFGYNYVFTLDHFIEALKKGSLAIKNTIIFSISSSVLVGLLGMVLAYLVVRDKFFGRRILDFLSVLPFAIPGTFMGIGYLLAFNRPPLLLTGTSLIIVLNCVVRKLPFSFKIGCATLSQIDKSIEEASLNLGANKVKTFFRVILPLLKPAIIFSMIYTFIATVKTLGSIIFLITPNTKVLSAMVFESTINYEFGVAACYAIIMTILSAIGTLLIWKLNGDKTWF